MQAQLQSLFLEYQMWHDGRRFPGPLYQALGRAPERREGVGFDSHADAPRTETVALSPGLPFVLPNVSATYAQTDSTNHRSPQVG